MAVSIWRRIKPTKKGKRRRIKADAGSSGAEGMPVEIIKFEPGVQIDPPRIVDISSLNPGIINWVGASATTTTYQRPADPTGLSVLSKTDQTVLLDWDDNSESDLAGYRVYKSTDNITFTEVITLTSTSAYNVPNLQISTLYYFKVIAVNTTGAESGFSNTVSETTNAGSGDPFLLVYPNNDPTQLDSSSIFYNDISVITNTAATFQVTAENLLGGTLNVYDYGYFDYERGAQTGTASFDYTVYDYDGLGNNTSATWTINVQ